MNNFCEELRMINRIIKKCISLTSIFSFWMCCSSFADNHTFDRTIVQNKLGQTVLKIKHKFKINAISLAIILPSENKPYLINNGTVKIGSNEKISRNDLFQIGSITKTFTSEIAAQTIANKKLHLSNTVGQFLPQYKKWKSITIEQLINQTSGIPDYNASHNWWGNLVKNPDRVWSSTELINIAYHMHENSKPGTAWAYSNTNYVLLGMILARVQGKSSKMMMQKLFQEEHLDNTYYLAQKYPEKILKKMVHGYYKKYDQTQINTSWLQMAGANVSNPNQIARWYNFLFNTENKTGLPITKFTSFVKTNNGKKTENISETGYSFGIFRMNTPQGLIYFTPGLTPGYTSMVVYAPCLNTYFSYSASSGLLKGFHKTMLIDIMKILNQEIKKNKIHTPKYCRNFKYKQQFIFPKI